MKYQNISLQGLSYSHYRLPTNCISLPCPKVNIIEHRLTDAYLVEV